MIRIILIIMIIVLIFIIWRKYKQSTNDVEHMVTLNTMPTDKPPFMSPMIEPNLIEAMFHQDYMDVITSFGNISPNQRQIFNINNVPCKVTQETDVSDVGDIVGQFIETLNNDISKNVPLVHTVSSGWDEQLPEQTNESGWEKVQRQLGLPTSLYNKPKMNTHVKLVQFSNITKYETENEVKYKCKIVIMKKKVHDKLVIQVEFVIPKGLINDGTNVIIETIHVLGYLTEQGLGTDRIKTDDFYYFDSLEKNNMITGKTVANELMKKYNLRKNVMQERIDGMDIDTQEKYYNSPSPAEYDTYKLTQTIFDDMKSHNQFN